MHTGLFLEFPALDDVTDQQAFQHGFQMAEEAERLGVESVWLAEYHFIPFSVLSSPVMVATAIAGRTERIRIGLGVLLLPLGNPIRIAEEIATLDHISQGRLDFGVGRGTFPEHHDAFLSPTPRAGAGSRSTWRLSSRPGPPISSPLRASITSAMTWRCAPSPTRSPTRPSA